MAIEMFLKIGTIVGESVDADHPGEIEVLAYSLGCSTAATVASGAGPASKPARQQMAISMQHSQASLALFEALCKGQRFPEATLTLRRQGEPRHTFLRIKLKKVIVTSQAASTSTGGDQLIEALSLDYGKLTFTHIGQGPDGMPTVPIVAGFDFVANRKA